MGGWVDRRSGLEVLEKRKISCLYRDSSRNRPYLNLVAISWSYSGRGDLRKLPKGQLRGFCYTPDIIQVIILRKMRWLWHVALMEKGELHAGFKLGNLKETATYKT